MHRDALIIVHPHYGCTPNATMPCPGRMRQLNKGQEWARENPLAERILCEHNGRDSIYKEEALLARERREIVFMLDHDCFRQYRWDERWEIRQAMDKELASRVVEGVEGIKARLVSWFLDNFGEGQILNINHRNTGPHLRKNYPGFPCDMRIVLIGEYLHACVDEVSHSLSVMSFCNVHVDEEKCAA